MRKTSLFSDTVYGGAAIAIASAGRLALAVLLARRLGVDQFGQFVFIQWCVDLVALICLTGLPGTITRLLPQLQNQTASMTQPFVRLVVRWAVACLLIALVLSTVVFVSTIEATDSRLLILLVAWTVATLAGAVSTAILTGLFQFKALALSHSASLASGLTLAFVFVVPGALHTAVLVALVVPMIGLVIAVVCLVFTQPMATQNGTQVPIMPQRDIFPYAVNVWISQLTSSLLWTRGELGFLKAFGSDRDVGLYGIATTLTGAVVLGINLLQSAVAPHLSRAHAEGDRQAIADMIRLMSSLCFFAAFNVVILLVLVHDQLVSAVFGEAYSDASSAILILSIGISAAATGTVNLLIQYETNGRFQRNLHFFAVAVLGCVGIILIPQFGIQGAAATRAIIITGLGVAVLTRLARHGYRDIGMLILSRWAMATLTMVLVMWIKIQFDPAWLAIAMLYVASATIFAILFLPLLPVRQQFTKWLRTA